ncbi:hypothetical protein HDV05_005629 [Chytridiales sp. JEL 0842]|nr:hypothetical protein HDV05_005629 [Chytridiales sp. JEL 0842]
MPTAATLQVDTTQDSSAFSFPRTPTSVSSHNRDSFHSTHSNTPPQPNNPNDDDDARSDATSIVSPSPVVPSPRIRTDTPSSTTIPGGFQMNLRQKASSAAARPISTRPLSSTPTSNDLNSASSSGSSGSTRTDLLSPRDLILPFPVSTTTTTTTTPSTATGPAKTPISPTQTRAPQNTITLTESALESLLQKTLDTFLTPKMVHLERTLSALTRTTETLCGAVERLEAGQGMQRGEWGAFRMEMQDWCLKEREGGEALVGRLEELERRVGGLVERPEGVVLDRKVGDGVGGEDMLKRLEGLEEKLEKLSGKLDKDDEGRGDKYVKALDNLTERIQEILEVHDSTTTAPASPTATTEKTDLLRTLHTKIDSLVNAPESNTTLLAKQEKYTKALENFSTRLETLLNTLPPTSPVSSATPFTLSEASNNNNSSSNYNLSQLLESLHSKIDALPTTNSQDIVKYTKALENFVGRLQGLFDGIDSLESTSVPNLATPNPTAEPTLIDRLLHLETLLQNLESLIHDSPLQNTTQLLTSLPQTLQTTLQQSLQSHSEILQALLKISIESQFEREREEREFERRRRSSASSSSSLAAAALAGAQQGGGVRERLRKGSGVIAAAVGGLLATPAAAPTNAPSASGSTVSDAVERRGGRTGTTVRNGVVVLPEVSGPLNLVAVAPKAKSTAEEGEEKVVERKAGDLSSQQQQEQQKQGGSGALGGFGGMLSSVYSAWGTTVAAQGAGAQGGKET